MTFYINIIYKWNLKFKKGIDWLIFLIKSTSAFFKVKTKNFLFFSSNQMLRNFLKCIYYSIAIKIFFNVKIDVLTINIFIKTKLFISE